MLPYNLLLFVGLLATAWIAKKRSLVSFKRSINPVLSVRVPNAVNAVIVNEGAAATLRLRDEPPSNMDSDATEFTVELQEDDEKEVRYLVIPRERGSDYFRGTFVRYLAPGGLCWVHSRLATEQPVRVYPNVQAIREFELLKQRGRLSMMGIRKSRIKGLGTEFESLRDYNDDDFRRIDWKTTARRGKLVVRDFEQERNQVVIVCLDIGRKMLGEVGGVRKMDHALDACLMLLHAASLEGDQVGLLVYGDRVRRYLPPRKGRNQGGAILEAAHALVADPVESNPKRAFSYLASRWKRRSLLVVFTDAESTDESEELVSALGPLARRHLIMVVRVADPRLKELVAAPMCDDRSFYQRSAAYWYTVERKRAGSQLSIFGIQNIDAEPQELTTTLVSAYLHIKATSAL